MLKQGLKALGQSLLIVAGVGYGVIKALEVFETDFQSGKTQMDAATVKRLDDMEERLIRMEKSLEALALPNPSQPPNDVFVTRQEMNAATERLSAALDSNSERLSAALDSNVERLSAALDSNMQRLSTALDSDIERRFEVQNRSVQSLRTMVARTDELLEQVLESIEANSIPA